MQKASSVKQAIHLMQNTRSENSHARHARCCQEGSQWRQSLQPANFSLQGEAGSCSSCVAHCSCSTAKKLAGSQLHLQYTGARASHCSATGAGCNMAAKERSASMPQEGSQALTTLHDRQGCAGRSLLHGVHALRERDAAHAATLRAELALDPRAHLVLAGHPR